MFVGREKELKILKEEMAKKSSSVLIYGKRKIGKTTLIKEAYKQQSEKPYIYFECIKDIEERNIEELMKLLKKMNIMSEFISLPTKSFLDLFRFLDSLNKDMIVVIDEYPYLKECTKSNTIDSVFQNIIDNNISNINLVISGSHIGMMRDLIEEKNALFGRFDKIIELKELSYLEVSSFYQNKSNYEKAAFFAIFGGSPFVNEQINPNLSIKDNVVKNLLDKNSALYNYASSLLISDLSNQIQANRILSILGNGRKSYKELEEILDKNKTGLLSKQLKPLLDIELIKKVAPINKLNDVKKAKYEINDNLLSFYFKYILPNQYLFDYKDIGMLYDEEIAPTLTTYISYRFEDLCREFLWNYVNQNKIKNVVDIGRYYYDDPINKTNGEFDLAILNKDGSVQIIEAKYLTNEVTNQIIQKEIKQINSIKEFDVDKVGFISINGYKNISESIDYMFSGEDIYSAK
ncbi:MAG: AAA family ATPase [Bacilli bacterium]|nr:AAA family ATPase [Bacilli bacterium]